METLDRFVEKYPHLKPILEVLEPLLYTSPSKITVYSFKEARKMGVELDKYVLGLAVKPDKLFFRDIPPPVDIFTHELIHLCRKYVDEQLEEWYAYNFTPIVLYMAEHGLKADIFKLVTLSRKDIEEVLKKFKIETIEEYYELRGVVPPSHMSTVVDGKLKIVPLEGVDEFEIVRNFIRDLSACLEYDYLCREIFHELLKLAPLQG